MESYIENYVGEWADLYGQRLRVTEEDHFLDAYYHLFQPLSHYVKTPG